LYVPHTPAIYTLYLHDALPISHALGKFKDLLSATAHSPAMLFYLDNWLSADPNAFERPKHAPPKPNRPQRPPAKPVGQVPPLGRSEEHTSELSHGSISYAVFCL